MTVELPDTQAELAYEAISHVYENQEDTPMMEQSFDLVQLEKVLAEFERQTGE